MFLKEKHDGTIKAWGYADGRPQRLYTTKEEASSSTVSLAMMLSCATDTKVNRYVVVTDIHRRTVQMLLEGEIADLIVKLEPETYHQYIWHNHKEKQ